MSVTVDQKNRRICGGLTALLSLLSVLISAPAYGQPNSTRNPASQNQANQNIDAALVNSHEQSVASLLPTTTGPDKPAHLTAITHCEIFFQSDLPVAAILNDQKKACIEGLLEEFDKLTDAKLKIYGHQDETDEDGLSRKFAEYIQDYLIKEFGVAAANVVVHKPDFGHTCPHVENKKNKNRRVEIWIVHPGNEDPRSEALKESLKKDPENEALKKCLQNVPKTNPPESSATSNGSPPS